MAVETGMEILGLVIAGALAFVMVCFAAYVGVSIILLAVGRGK